jgi:hypothetical protein
MIARLGKSALIALQWIRREIKKCLTHAPMH